MTVSPPTATGTVTVSEGTTALGSATATTLKASKPSQLFKNKSVVKLTATVTGKPAGTVSFFEGKKLLKKVTLAKGSASLAKGKHKITAVFVPKDPEAFSTSSSKAVTISVVN